MAGGKDSPLTVPVRIDGLRETLAALNRIGRDANVAIRQASLDLAGELARAAAESGRLEGRQAALVAETVKARKDRVPVVVAGGAKRLGSNRKPAWKLLFGSEFGATVLEQYKPHLGRGSYWFFRTIEEEQVLIGRRWLQAADEIIAKFGGGVDGGT